MSYPMPIVHLSQTNLNEEQLEIAALCIGRGNRIRANKPVVSKDKPRTGKAAYVWRMVVFIASQNPVHQCMPMTADFDLPSYDETGKWSCAAARVMAKELDVIVDELLKQTPAPGALRWGRALGHIQ